MASKKSLSGRRSRPGASQDTNPRREPEFSGDKLALLDKLDNEYRRKHRRTLLTMSELRQTSVASLYRKSPKEQERTINRIYKRIKRDYPELFESDEESEN